MANVEYNHTCEVLPVVYVRRHRFHLLYFLVLAFCALAQGQDTCTEESWCPQQPPSLCENPVMAQLCRKSCGLCGTKETSGCPLECSQLCDAATKKCLCKDGYTLQDDGFTCEDINECDTIAPCNDTHTFCKNYDGGYSCQNAEQNCVDEKGFTPYYKNPSQCCKQSSIQYVSGKCGLNAENIGRIVNGSDTEIEMWPWMAYVSLDGQLCGGSLINENWIVTAAHCFSAYDSGPKINPVEVTFGMSNTSDSRETTRQVRTVKRYIMHENYDYPKFDIAVAELNESVKWSKFVNPICLPNGEVAPTGTKCFATGYGTTAFRGSVSQKLQEVDLPIVNIDTCVRRYEDEITIDPESMICAGYVTGGKDACQGDSGGPLVCQRCDSCDYYLAGVVSFGKGCALPGNYGVYTNVETTEKWIADQIKGVSITKKECVKKEWSDWQPWQSCTATCGGGRQTRLRFCLNGIAGQDGCFGKNLQRRKCNTGSCVTEWGEFEDWSPCTTSCGGGETTRTRQCMNGQPGDAGCEGLATETEACNNQVCPSWGEWEFGECSTTCGDGTKQGTRVCNNGSPGDLGCKGPTTKSVNCGSGDCEVWGPWSACGATCGDSVQTSTCTSCSPIKTKERACNIKNCPVWDNWEEWDACSLSCGRGRQKARRVCKFGVAGEGGCTGPKTRTRRCNTEECPAPFSPWSDWTTCTKTCAKGTQIRTRSCPTTLPCIADDFNSSLSDIRLCNLQDCPVWGDWSAWSDCTVSCGVGSSTRSRPCIGGNPQDRGCEGEAKQTSTCNNQACAKWGDWEEWSKCTASCGGGTRTRSRKCIGGSAGDAGCEGLDTNDESCNNHPCPEVCSDDCKLYVQQGYCINYDLEAIGCSKSCCECVDDPLVDCSLGLFAFFGCETNFFECKASCGLCVI